MDKKEERAVVPVSAAKLFSTGFRLILIFVCFFFFFAVLGLAASLAV